MEHLKRDYARGSEKFLEFNPLKWYFLYFETVIESETEAVENFLQYLANNL